MGVRLHKSSHRIHRFAQMAWLRLFSHGIHGIHRSFVASVLPQICTEVRLHKSSHRFHGFAQMAWLRLFSHGIHRIHRSFVASVLPRNSQNSQKFCCVGPPTDFTDQHRWLVALIRPRNSRNSQKFCCVGSPTEFTEFTEVWLRRSSHGIHGIHRSLWVLLAAWVRQDAIPSYICVNPCYLLETLLCKKLLCVPWVLWAISLLVLLV